MVALLSPAGTQRVGHGRAPGREVPHLWASSCSVSISGADPELEVSDGLVFRVLVFPLSASTFASLIRSEASFFRSAGVMGMLTDIDPSWERDHVLHGSWLR